MCPLNLTAMGAKSQSWKRCTLWGFRNSLLYEIGEPVHYRQLTNLITTEIRPNIVSHLFWPCISFTTEQ